MALAPYIQKKIKSMLNSKRLSPKSRNYWKLML
jgi:hypothetical protein